MEYGDLRIIKYLVEHGSDVNAKDIHNTTPLHIAASNVHFDALRYLIYKGANVNAIDKWGTPLLSAVNNFNDNWIDTLSVVKCLIYNGADINIKNKQKQSPLDLAIRNPNSHIYTHVVEYLIERGAVCSTTSLYTAVFLKHLETVKILVATGISVNKQYLNSERFIKIIRSMIYLKENHIPFTFTPSSEKYNMNELIENILYYFRVNNNIKKLTDTETSNSNLQLSSFLTQNIKLLNIDYKKSKLLHTLSLSSLIDSNLINSNLYDFLIKRFYNKEDLLRATLIILCNYKQERKLSLPIFSTDEFYYISSEII